MAKPRATLDSLTADLSGQDNLSSVGPAPMDPQAEQVEPKTPAPVRVVEEPAGEHPVTKDPAKAPAPKQAVEPEPEFESEPEPSRVRHVEIQPSQPGAALHHPADLQPVRISAPVHARKKKPDQIQLSVKLSGPLLERFEKARYELGLHGNSIGVEAIEIWLVHNGF